ncbi:hypothetical protein HDE69_001942 [Pedobacter cryoconitis]|uniref:Phage abortive infection protein n=1 Tax=Pedobacter cryoconitis TaxID=188932 RepID=A0A7W9DJN0_9SPHI|nr:hypothetical protein [Pedobacter cryoconitis]MBB5620889.1 hypothetical protein [Pedobacter cryoconitis]
MKTRHIVLIVILVLVIIILGYLPIYLYRDQFDKSVRSNLQADWGTFGDYIGGLLNPFISLLTLLVTSYIAYILFTYESRRDAQSKEEGDVKSFMELYQFFMGIEFRAVRTMAWDILKKAIANDKYRDFIVKENYVSRYIGRQSRADVYREFKGVFYQKDHLIYSQEDNESAFLKQEAFDRNNVDILINFFQLLSFKNVPENYYKICDFYYDTWRPVLYWYATQLENAYLLLEENKRFNNPPNLLEALKKLDERFYKPEILAALKEEKIETHPIILHMQGKSL